MAYNTRAGPRLNASRTVSTGLSQTDGKGSDGIAQSSHHGHQQHTAPRTEASSQKRFGEYVYRQDFGDVNLPSDERFLADGPLDDADADMMYASYIYPNPNAGPTPASSTLRHAGSPSPGVPSLSPPSTAGPSSPSSSYSSLVSPSVAPPTPTYFNRRGSLSNQLLSSANIHEASPNQGHRRIQAFPSPSYTHQSSSTDRSWFAQQQAAFLHQQQQQEFNGTVPPSTPPRARTSSEGVRSSTTPRAMTQAWRSPAGSPYSAASTSPQNSPFARSRPSPYMSPSQRPGRRGSIGDYSPSSSPTKSSPIKRSQTSNGFLSVENSPARRRPHSALSIDVPSAQYRPASRAESVFSVASSGSMSDLGLPDLLAERPDALVEFEASQEMEQLLGQLGSFLSEDLRTSDSAVSMIQDNALLTRPPAPTHSLSAPAAPLLSSVSPLDDSTNGSIEISGVTLSQEDMALLDGPDFDIHPRSYPASAPPWQTSFDLGPGPLHASYRPLGPPRFTSSPFAPSHEPAYDTHVASLPTTPVRARHTFTPGQPVVLDRPRSVDQHSPTYPPPPVIGVRRRRSSVDDGAAYAAAYHGSNTPQEATHSSQRSPQRPPRASRHSYHPPSPTRPGTSMESFNLRDTSSIPLPLLPPHTPVKATPPPSPRKTVNRSPQKSAGMPMFINYGAQDSKKLLNGVAPSGSSKRKKEEADAAQKG